ncbi:MAG TPA: Hpt domain-containing protein [Candidatus Nanopelagicales bacterium]|nr:Hpt domain-containing protein [Candidatus Nanopelagicales bacterium]
MTDPAAELLDLQRLATLVDEIGDLALVREAVQTFLDESPDRLAAIRVALAGGDGQEIRSAAHALGSPAAMLGAAEVSRVSKLLQAAALEGRIDDCRPLVEQITDVARRTDTAMRDYLAQSATA